MIIKSKYSNTDSKNSPITSEQEYVDVYSWNICLFFFKFAQTSVFLFIYLFRILVLPSFPVLLLLCGTGKQPCLFDNVYHCFPSHDMTGSNMDVMKGNGVETLMSMLSTSKDIWCTEKAHSYLGREKKKMGHCLSVASLTARSHNNWSAFLDTLILMRPNPLFSPQWIHR